MIVLGGKRIGTLIVLSSCFLLILAAPLGVDSQFSSAVTLVSDGIMLSQTEVPTARANLMLTYDIESDRVILYGGWTAPAPWEEADTWAYDHNTDAWTDMTTENGPPKRSVSQLAYDSQSDRIVMFGGMQDFAGSLTVADTWVYDFNINTWTETTPASSPSLRTAYEMVYDSESDRIILFGGYPGLNDTWAYDVNSNTWEEMGPAVAPGPRYFHAMAYDVDSDRVILFGGYRDDPGPGGTQSHMSDTWAYDYNTDTWNELSPSTSPIARRAHAMTYDNESDRTVLFGGSDSSDFVLGDTWEYDYNSDTWTESVNATHPSARDRHRMAYDYESDVTVLFGGNEISYNSESHVTEDTMWFYDANTNSWTAGDSDQDGLLDSLELIIGTDPFNNDTESDGMPDGWEYFNELDPLADDSEADPDSDLLQNIDEFRYNANPQLNDTDADELLDGLEVGVHHTDPNNSDTDSDGIPDGWEVNNDTDPLVNDADDDDDGDGLDNAEEFLIGTNPQSSDTDGDGMGDKWERDRGFDPTNAADGFEDDDGDGLLNWQEFEAGSNPFLADSDGDTFSDLWEVQFGFNPADGNIQPMQIVVFYSPIIAGGVLIAVLGILGLRYRQRQGIRSVEERQREEEEKERRSVEELLEYTNDKEEDSPDV
jgi:N-acetylneuraminic acid mutarotase